MRAPLVLVILVALIAASPAAAEDPPTGEAKPAAAAKPPVRKPAPRKPAALKPVAEPAAHDPAATSGAHASASHEPAPRPRGRPAPAPPAAPVATFDVVTQENLLWTALSNGDQAAVGGLLADDVVFVGRDGVRRKADFLDTLVHCRVYGVRVTDTVRRPLTADVTALAYRVRYQASCQGQQLTGDQTETSVWMRQGPSWRLVLHTEIDSPQSGGAGAAP